MERKSGKETFFFDNVVLPVTLLDFWQWSASDLLSNAQRGVLAEFLVASALDLPLTIREEWAKYDLISLNGTTIEVKSSAYLQSWHQNSVSKISFSITRTLEWDSKTNVYGTEKKRQAHVYVFCVLNHFDKNTVNPLDLSQWIFYLLPTKVLDEKHPFQKTISLSSLLKLDPVSADFKELKTEFLKIEKQLLIEKNS